MVTTTLLPTLLPTLLRTMQGNDKLLERMYCFKEVDEDTRMVIHVHTLVRWGDRAKLHPNSRARKVCLPPQIPCCASAPPPSLNPIAQLSEGLSLPRWALLPELSVQLIRHSTPPTFPPR